MQETGKTAERIGAEMARMDKLVVAFSGGVDSSVVAALAERALGARASAVTVVSETLKSRELTAARAVAREIGVRHRVISLSELDDPRFTANSPSRCYFCQSMRFEQVRRLGRRLGCDVIASGTNLSDLGDFRPGLRAMREQGVYQPLLEHRVDKAGVRAIAKGLGLSVWDKPAQACLSSRIPHGLEVTDERLRRIESAEEVLAGRGFRQYRVRDLDGKASIEVESGDLSRFEDPVLLKDVSGQLRALGFREVVVDPAGYRSGSLNPQGAAGNPWPGANEAGP